jgi:hypothetical protein
MYYYDAGYLFAIMLLFSNIIKFKDKKYNIIIIINLKMYEGILRIIAKKF